jgi:phosphatidylserine decarboxylase
LSLLDRLLVLPQHWLPQRALTGAVHRLARVEGIAARLAVRAFRAAYDVELDEAVVPVGGFRSFNAFFTRALQAGARPIDARQGLAVSPADGTISQLGDVRAGSVLQAKGREFPLAALLAGDTDLLRGLADGRFATVYLSPRDYHRVHAPFACAVRSVRYVHGRLFSVNDRTAREVGNLYARNERLVLACDTEWGPAAIVMVGAMLVSAMEASCCDVPALARRSRGVALETLREPRRYARGEELGRFNMGSTVIVLLPRAAPAWRADLGGGAAVRVGEALSLGPAA